MNQFPHQVWISSDPSRHLFPLFSTRGCVISSAVLDLIAQEFNILFCHSLLSKNFKDVDEKLLRGGEANDFEIVKVSSVVAAPRNRAFIK
jgi:hypothetical protein